MPDQLTDAVILGGNRIPFGKSGGAYRTWGAHYHANRLRRW